MEPEKTGAELFAIANRQARETATCTKTSRWFGKPYAIEGKITNNSKEVTEGQIRFKLLDKAGCKIGEAADTCENIAPGETWHYKAYITVEDYAAFELLGLYW